MTQEEKQLLLKDLCARLPYGVKINIYDYSGTMKNEELNAFHINSTYNIEYRKLRPYLKPMSSMTTEEFDEYMHFTKHSWEGIDKEEDDYYVKVKDRDVYFDWLLEHHFDYRGLIEKGLALEAPEGMYKIE